MKINQAFRYELKPNVTQRILLAKHAGTARFAYNWGLAERIKLFEAKEGKERFTSALAQHKVLNALKAVEYHWMYENLVNWFLETTGSSPESNACGDSSTGDGAKNTV